MTLVDRGYPDIVRDVLTNLTHGVTGEVHRVDYDPLARPVVVPPITLQRRPVRRVSVVTGLIAQPGDAAPAPVTFSLNDYELVADPADPADLHTIRFLPGGRVPAPGTDVRVNYYPRTTDPAPLTDISVGSVTRTLVEALSKELALAYAQLNLAHEAGYLELATGASLDRVVALLGYTRFRAGRPVGSVRFGRRAGAVGDVSIPAGTPVTDLADTIRYLTVESRTMLAGESTAEVRVRGASDATPVVAENTLTVIQRAVAGLDTVVNERPTSTASADETDAELRARTRVALLSGNKGTLGALEHGLLQLPEVRAVSLVEMPNGVPGEVRIGLSLADPSVTAVPASVRDRIDELRPAGIVVVPFLAGAADLTVHLALVLAGSHLPPADVQQVHQRAADAITEVVGRIGVGQTVRTGPLTAAVLADERIVDATVTLARQGVTPAGPGADLTPAPGEAVRLVPPVTFAADVFDRPPATAGGAIPVTVTASVAAQPQSGADLDAVRARLTESLTGYLTGLTAGTAVTVGALLPVLRDDANYQIDPLRLLLTFRTDEQFAEVAEGGPAFTVLAGQRFTLETLEVVA